MHDTTLMLGQLIENINDIEEAGWEQEIKEAERLAKEQGLDKKYPNLYG